ncbi:MAG: CBS domain-containing protein [Acidimicrobiia bacterium]|nr:CBS domain-containing protein [Acidimicrobiia bacterium]
MTQTGISQSGRGDRRAITLLHFHIALDEAHTVTLSDTLQDVERVMDRHNIDQVPVVGAEFDGAMVVTRRGVATVSPTERADTPVSVALQEHSNDPNQRVRASTLLAEAAECLIEYDWVLTTDEEGRPMGLATVGDALRAALKG